jgi:hypothetical protein
MLRDENHDKMLDPTDDYWDEDYAIQIFDDHPERLTREQPTTLARFWFDRSFTAEATLYRRRPRWESLPLVDTNVENDRLGMV